MNPLFKTVIVIIISSAVFTIILNQLYKSNSRALSFMNKIPKGWKGKYFMKWAVLLFLMFVVSLFVVVGGLNDTIGTIIIGFFISLTDLIFGKPIRKNQKDIHR